MSVPAKIGIGFSERRGFLKIAVSFPDGVYARIRTLAIHEHRSMSDMVSRLAQQGLRRMTGPQNEDQPVRPAPIAPLAPERRAIKDVIDLLTESPPKRLTAIERLEAMLNVGDDRDYDERS